MAYHTFGRLEKNSVFGDLNQHGSGRVQILPTHKTVDVAAGLGIQEGGEFTSNRWE